MRMVSQRKLAPLVDIDDFLAGFRSREASVGVIGLGYVGLPLSLAACAAGFRVRGFDINQERVEGLNGGRSPLRHIDEAKIAAAREGDRFAATSDSRQISDVDAILICVPTPLGPHREPDLSFVVDTVRMVAG